MPAPPNIPRMAASGHAVDANNVPTTINKVNTGSGRNIHRNCAGKAKNLLEPEQTNDNQFDRETRKKQSEQPIAAIAPFWCKRRGPVSKS